MLILVLIAVMAISVISCSNINIPTNYTIYFNVGTGSDTTVFAARRSHENDIISFPKDPTQKDCKFAGWYFDQSYAEEFHQYSYIDKPLEADLQVYAKFVPSNTLKDSYRIDFESNGGSAIERQTAKFGDKLDPETETPTRSGFKFEGWYRDAALTNPWYVEYDRVWQDITLYAGWNDTGYSITYELDGGTNFPSNPKSTRYLEDIVLKDPSKIGCEFEGWYLDAEINTPFDGTYKYYDDITIYAKWNYLEYHISYVIPSDVTLSSSAPTVYTTQYALVIPDPEKVDYYFVGWYFDSGFTQLYNPNKVYAQDMTLYPRFTSSPLLNPLEYDKMSSGSVVIFPYGDVSTKNLCIPLNSEEVVSAVYFNGVALSSSNYAYDDQEQLLGIAHSVFEDVRVGNRYTFTVEFDDSSISEYFFTAREDVKNVIGSTVYYKTGSNTNFDLYLDVTLNENEFFGVVIDGKEIPYTLGTAKVTLDGATLSSLPKGNYLVEMATIYGSIYSDIQIENYSFKVPYNINIELENDPYTIITWDCDFTPDKFIVTISGEDYNSIDNAALFDEKAFNASGLLKVANQSYSVAAEIDGEIYSSDVMHFKYDLYDSLASAERKSSVSKYLQNNLSVYGKEFNRYITSWQEAYEWAVNILINENTIGGEFEAFNSTYSDYVATDVCFDFDLESTPQVDLDSVFYNGIAEKTFYDNRDFVSVFVQELFHNLPEVASYYLVISYPLNEGMLPKQTYRIGFKFNSVCALNVDRTLANTHSTINGQYRDVDYCYSLYSKTHLPSNYVFPIEQENNGDAEVYTSVELYLALEHGYNPIPQTPELEALYDTIKDVLRDILDEDMTDYEKVAAMYQWLATEVLYDHDAANSAESLSGEAYYPVYGWSCFYIEGVFNNHLAVCNGIADAYSAMCNMMGIPCHKVSGKAKGAEHAWNEVYVNGNWYISDATWGSITLTTKKIEALTFDYLFMTSYEAEQIYRHVAKVSAYDAHIISDVDINLYLMLSFSYNSTNYDLTLEGFENSSTFDAMLKYAMGKEDLSSGEYVSVTLYCPNHDIDYYKPLLSGYTILEIGSDYAQGKNFITAIVYRSV